MADSAVTIQLNLEPGDVKKTAAELQKAVKGIFEQTGGKGDTQTVQMLDKLRDGLRDIQKLRQDLATAETTKVLSAQDLEDIKALESELAKERVELGKLDEQREKLRSRGAIFGTEWEETNAKIQEVSASMTNLETEIAQMKDAGSVDAQAIQASVNALDEKNVKVGLLVEQYEQAKNKSTNLKNSTENVRRSLGGVSSAAKTAGNNLKRGFNDATKAVSAGIKKLFSYTLGITSIVALMRKIRSAAKEGLKALAEFDSEANGTLSTFTTDIQYLKNALATMFYPLIQVVAPIFRQFVDVLVDAINHVAQFFGAFTGAGKVYKAIRVQKDFADSIKKATDAQTKALASYDKLQTIQKSSSIDSGSSNSSGMFELVEVESSYKELANNVKEMFAGNGEELGKELADKVNNAITNFDWAGTGTSISNSIVGTLDFINTFLENVDASEVGGKIIEFLNEVDWDSIVDEIIRLLANIPTKLGELIAGGLQEALGLDDDNPFVQWTKDNFAEIGTRTTELLTSIKDIVGDLKPVIIGVLWIVLGIINGFNNLALRINDIIATTRDKIHNFMAKWTELFEGLKELFNGNVDKAKEHFIKSAKAGLNQLISFVNGLIDGLNLMLSPLLNIVFLTGKVFGAEWKREDVKIPHIPLLALAQGAVLPPNKPFLAMLGDQRQGTNVEAPLTTIKQAVREELANMGGYNNQPIILQLDGRTVAEVVWDENEKRYKQYGAYAY